MNIGLIGFTKFTSDHNASHLGCLACVSDVYHMPATQVTSDRLE